MVISSEEVKHHRVLFSKFQRIVLSTCCNFFYVKQFETSMSAHLLVQECANCLLPSSGDVSCLATIPSEVEAEATFIAKADGVIAGISLADMIFNQVDPSLKVSTLCHFLCFRYSTEYS
jgi:hypothetical protein